MVSIYYLLHLLFIARQGYWNEDAAISFRQFGAYIYHYLGISILLVIGMHSVGKTVFDSLSEMRIGGVVSADILVKGSVFSVILLGTIYENMHVHRSNTQETVRVFFNVTDVVFALGLWLKNIIIVSPALVIGAFINPLLTGIVFHIGHVLSFRKWTGHRGKNDRLIKRVTYWYPLTVMDKSAVLKALFVPVVSLGLIILLIPDQFVIVSDNVYVDLFSTAFFLGIMVFNTKGLVYYFLALIQDLSYLKATGIDVHLFLRRKLCQLMCLNVGVTLIPLGLYAKGQGVSMGQFGCLVLMFCLVFLAIQSIQIHNALFFKEKQLRHSKELDSYRLPFSDNVKVWLLGIPLLVISILVRVIPNQLVLGLLGVSVGTLVCMSGYYIKQGLRKWIQ